MINRYEVYPVIYSLSHWETRHIISDKGDWVDYEDHLEAIEAIKNRVCECHNKQASIDAKIRWNDNKINYCPYCGGKIEISEVEE